MVKASLLKRIWQRTLFYLSVLGPGLISASGDNDAPGVATYSLAGSTYGYGFLWLILWIAVGKIVVQGMAARIGVVTGKGLTDLIREAYGVKVTALVMLVLVIANLGTTVAQFAGVASSAGLFGISHYVMVPLVAAFIWFIVTRASYQRLEKTLLFVTLYSLAYIVSAIMVRPSWGQILRETIVPQIHFSRGYLLALMATLGTTMTPWSVAYLQASVADKGVTTEEYRYTQLDVIVGIVVGNMVSAFIVICTAATLFTRGISVETAEQAALALEPLAGTWARDLFGAGLLGASILAAAILPLATTYAVCEAFGWERGLDRRPDEAPAFYGLYTSLIVISAVAVLIPGLPLFPVMWLSQVLNAVSLPIVLVMMLRLGNNEQLMGEWRNSRLSNAVSQFLIIAISIGTLVLLWGGVF